MNSDFGLYIDLIRMQMLLFEKFSQAASRRQKPKEMGYIEEWQRTGAPAKPILNG